MFVGATAGPAVRTERIPRLILPGPRPRVPRPGPGLARHGLHHVHDPAGLPAETDACTLRSCTGRRISTARGPAAAETAPFTRAGLVARPLVGRIVHHGYGEVDFVRSVHGLDEVAPDHSPGAVRPRRCRCERAGYRVGIRDARPRAPHAALSAALGSGPTLDPRVASHQRIRARPGTLRSMPPPPHARATRGWARESRTPAGGPGFAGGFGCWLRGRDSNP